MHLEATGNDRHSRAAAGESGRLPGKSITVSPRGARGSPGQNCCRPDGSGTRSEGSRDHRRVSRLEERGGSPLLPFPTTRIPGNWRGRAQPGVPPPARGLGPGTPAAPQAPYEPGGGGRPHRGRGPRSSRPRSPPPGGGDGRARQQEGAPARWAGEGRAGVGAQEGFPSPRASLAGQGRGAPVKPPERRRRGSARTHLAGTAGVGPGGGGRGSGPRSGGTGRTDETSAGSASPTYPAAAAAAASSRCRAWAAAAAHHVTGRRGRAPRQALPGAGRRARERFRRPNNAVPSRRPGLRRRQRRRL